MDYIMKKRLIQSHLIEKFINNILLIINSNIDKMLLVKIIKN